MDQHVAKECVRDGGAGARIGQKLQQREQVDVEAEVGEPIQKARYRRQDAVALGTLERRDYLLAVLPDKLPSLHSITVHMRMFANLYTSTCLSHKKNCAT